MITKVITRIKPTYLSSISIRNYQSSPEACERYRRHEEALERAFVKKRDIDIIRTLFNNMKTTPTAADVDTSKTDNIILKKHNITVSDKELTDKLNKWRLESTNTGTE